MEEFKKPCLPVTSAKLEKSKDDLNKVNEISENCDEADTTLGTTQTQTCPYKIPQWSDCPVIESNYSFEILKSGQIIYEIKNLQEKAYWTFGRLPENDIEMAHPTISRFHAVLQYRPKLQENITNDLEKNEEDSKTLNENKGPPQGWYIYDLGSTHGTFLNKQRIPSKIYIRIRVGHMLRLGCSTRSFILQGPSEDEEPESDLSVTELKAKRQKELDEYNLEKERLDKESIERANNEGCSWGMSEDATEETDLAHNPYASTNNEELFLDDPKKTLRGFFEREGLELVYKCEEMSVGSFICRVELPLDDSNGRPIVAEVVHKGKKKESVVQCALEACRILDRHGVLRQANQEPLKKKFQLQESDSDDDEFWDRTGDVARKKQRKANANASLSLTYEDLLNQEKHLDEQIKQIELDISNYQEQQKRLKAQNMNEGEDLDAFMENLQEKVTKLDKTEIRKLRLEEQRLKSEKQKLQRLIKIAKPINLSFSVQATDKQSQTPSQGLIKKQLPMIGKRKQFSKFKIIKTDSPVTKKTKPAKVFNSDEEEIEEFENQDEKSKTTSSSEEKQQSCNATNERINNTKDNIKEDKQIEETKTSPKREKNISTLDITNQHFLKYSKATSENKYEDHASTLNKRNESTNSSLDLQSTESVATQVNSYNKKRRHRIRQRSRRQEVDMDDDAEYESADKYAKWVPPENQTGDGFTELNKKFGY